MADDNGNLLVVPGRYVQWKKNGVDQWPEPRLVLAISDDGKLAFPERATEGIPLSELRVVWPQKPRKA